VRDWLRWQAGVLLDDRLRGKVDVSDVVQDTLLKACQHRDQLRGQSEGEKRAWLRRILANTLTDLVRCYPQGRKRNVGREQSLDEALRRSSVRLADGLADSSVGPEHKAEQQERLLWLAAGLAGLPEEQRQAVQLRHLHGCAVDEIARQMNRSIASVAGLLRRGLDTLRQRAAEP
jgi:RNA polymerase sigma-70 factor (ECF subfamily)